MRTDDDVVATCRLGNWIVVVLGYLLNEIPSDV
jgi:hypothetical protein